MQNPFRSEAEAYRFLLLTVGYFAVIVVAAALTTWLGVVVFVTLTTVAVWRWWRSRQVEAPTPTPVPRAGAEGERRILVIANETVGGRELLDALVRTVGGAREEVLVVCPALNSRTRTWASDEDGARAAAQVRLDASLARLRAAGVQARGEVGDGDPLQAIEDAVRTFGPDEIVISTHPAGRSNWLERDVVGSARDRFDVTITHVVVDLGSGTEHVQAGPGL